MNEQKISRILFVHPWFRKRGTISEEENRLFFSSFCMTKRKIFCPFYFYKMGRWRCVKQIDTIQRDKRESETSPFSSHIVIQER
ncbi:hypothetical protein OBG91_15895, partial [Lactococcus lactis]|nr:hypothetical protein [Lactococcus lactis]